MKNLFTVILCILSFQSIAQSLVGIPFLDRNRKVGECLVCNPTDSSVVSYLDEVGKTIDEKLKKFDYSKETYKDQIAYLDSLILDKNQSDAVKVRLIYTKIRLYLIGVIEEGNMVYNFTTSTVDSLTDYSGAAKIVSYFDEILALNIDEVSRTYFQNVKLLYYTQSYLLYQINEGDMDWLKDEKMLTSLPKAESNIAQNFLSTKKTTTYNPYSTYDAYGLGVSTSFGKELWYGAEFSYDPNMETINPFRMYHPLLGYRKDTRISWVSSKLLINNNFDKIDFLFSVLDVKNLFGFKFNLLQYGLHSTPEFENKFFYRPEVGYTYGIFTLSYAYNLTFDNSIRSSTEKHMVNFSISYPLIRIGKYY